MIIKGGGSNRSSVQYKIVTQHSITSDTTIDEYNQNTDQVLLFKNGSLLTPSLEYGLDSEGVITLVGDFTDSSDSLDAVILRQVDIPVYSVSSLVTEGQVSDLVSESLSGLTQLSLQALSISGDATVSGTLTAGKVVGSVWNDLADAIEITNEVELIPGRCYLLKGTEAHLSQKKGKGIPVIHSDTYGMLMGNGKGKRVNVALTGFVLAYVDKQYETGTKLTYGNNGVLTKAKIFDQVVGRYFRVEDKTTWNGIKVDGRHWIKVR